MQLKEWVEEQKEQYPDADTDILRFIGETASWNTDTETDYKNTPECLFSNGYCYHFAVMLQHLFGGEIMWHKFHSHIVYMDDKQIPYDAHGVFDDYEEGELLPVSVLSDVDLKLFQHVGDFSEPEIRKGNLETALKVKVYEIENGADNKNMETTSRMIKYLSDKLTKKNSKKELE